MRAKVAEEVIAENEHLLTKVSREEEVRGIVPSAALVILTSDRIAANVVDYCHRVREEKTLITAGGGLCFQRRTDCVREENETEHEDVPLQEQRLEKSSRDSASEQSSVRVPTSKHLQMNAFQRLSAFSRNRQESCADRS